MKKRKAPKVTLPAQKSEIAQDMHDFTWLIYGRKKIGKSSLVAHFPGTLFVPFEPGLRALSVYKIPDTGHCMRSWRDFMHYVPAIEESEQFQNIVIDPGNTAYQRCLEYTCDELNIQHPGKVKDYGASWKAVSQNFQNLHDRLAAAGKSYIILAHETTTDIEGYDGREYERVIPKFSGAAEDYYEGVIDIIGYYTYVKQYRVMQIRGDQFTVAGCRVENAFLTPHGERIVRVPMGNSSTEAYNNLYEAYHNRQQYTFADESELIEFMEPKGGARKRKTRVRGKTGE
jgi:hypothetical protein